MNLPLLFFPSLRILGHVEALPVTITPEINLCYSTYFNIRGINL
uniref:Uncharacterized protein n=1 Tax=Ciona intestinalis TaxID=7719 RepID=H2XUB1_CIOIN